MLNLKNYYVPGVTNRKLSDRRVGPFMIEDIYGKQACKLALPKHWKIHPVISIADLEPLPESEDPYAAGRTRATSLWILDKTSMMLFCLWPRTLSTPESRKT